MQHPERFEVAKEAEIGEEIRQNYDAFFQSAKEWTEKFAC